MILKTTKLLITFLLCLNIVSCKNDKTIKNIKVSEDLELIKINDHSYIHISKIFLESGKDFLSNGFIYVNNSEAYIFDTPANDLATAALIDWLQNNQKVVIKGVVFNHFHRDCNEGMDVFEKEKIPTIASKRTAKLMLNKNRPQPNLLFENSQELKLGGKTIINKFFGEAHTADNIISYFPDEKIIFGGCMIKSIDAKKGNLADANLSEWSKTVSKIKKSYPNVEIVIPGHGTYGDQSLLDYTISLFKTE